MFFKVTALIALAFLLAVLLPDYVRASIQSHFTNCVCCCQGPRGGDGTSTFLRHPSRETWDGPSGFCSGLSEHNFVFDVVQVGWVGQNRKDGGDVSIRAVMATLRKLFELPEFIRQNCFSYQKKIVLRVVQICNVPAVGCGAVGAAQGPSTKYNTEKRYRLKFPSIYFQYLRLPKLRVTSSTSHRSIIQLLPRSGCGMSCISLSFLTESIHL